MHILTITNIGNSVVSVQDPYPSEGKLRIALFPGQIQVIPMQGSQAERIIPVLDTLVTAGNITYSMTTGISSEVINDSSVLGDTVSAALDNLIVAGGSIEWLDEGISQGIFAKVNLIGPDIFGIPDGVDPTQFNIYVPTPSYQSHWNTADGASGNQAVSDSLARLQAHISTPNGGEGSPFNTNGWADSNHDATIDGVAVCTTPGQTTGWGGDSTLLISVVDADGSSLLDSFLILSIVGDGVQVSPSTFITATFTLFAPDGVRSQAHASVEVDVASILSGAGLVGGRYHIRITHVTDSTSDGTGPYIYTQDDVFLDDNPTTPNISGAVTIAERVGSIVTKHLSGVEYYTLTSQFTAGATSIDQLNRETAAVSGNLVWLGTEYGLPALSQCPFGAGAANFTGWISDNDCDGVDYEILDWAVSQPNYRYLGPSGSVDAQPVDPWAGGSVASSADANILIDTYGVTSTLRQEYFDDEARREDPASFPGAGTWNSGMILSAGAAQVWNSRMIVPATSTYIRSDGPNTPNADWTAFKPDLGGVNPDYSAMGVPVNYGRRFEQAPGSNIPSFTMVFSGSFAAGDMLADLIAGNVEIYVYRMSGSGFTGPPPANTHPLRIHEPYNFSLWDDGLTVPGSGIREGSSSGNTLNCTFGTGTPADTGFYCHVQIHNPSTQIDSMAVTFW